MQAVVKHNQYFVQKGDVVGQLDLSPEQKLASVFRQLVYGLPTDSTNAYTRCGESTTIEALIKFCRVFLKIYVKWYHQRPNLVNIQRLLIKGEHLGFPGMLGSLDCMH